jgi:hypothetical protein
VRAIRLHACSWPLAVHSPQIAAETASPTAGRYRAYRTARALGLEDFVLARAGRRLN